MSETGWEGILEDGEEIIWQGQPDPGFYVRPENIFLILFGLAFAGFALFWMIMASQAGGIFWMFGLIHFSVGLWLAFWSIFKGTLQRRNTWYTLTNQRAIIATDYPFKDRSIAFYPITAKSNLEMRSNGRFGSVYFANATRLNNGRRVGYQIGFERLTDPATALDHLRSIQKALP